MTGVSRRGSLGLIALWAAGAARAEDHGGHAMPGMDMSPATAAYGAANTRMHDAMMIEYTGNPDIDFARGMIPHHAGAVDMARVELEHGTDPEMRAFAEKVIAAQTAEIAFLEAWLAKKGG